MIRARCDEKFETASQQFEKARTDLMVVTATCINEAAQDLAHACGKFANRDIATMREQLVKGLVNHDITVMSAAVRAYLNTVDTEKLPFADPTPETTLWCAVDCLKQAIGEWAEDKFDMAHASTVRCRFDVDKLRDIKS